MKPVVSAELEYRAFGRPGGYPVVVHHGLVGSASVSPDAATEATRRNIELIAIARPGYGQSAPRSMSSIGEWHALVTPLLDELEIERYSVWGISAGAPYAYALAALDPDRVDGVAVTSGLGFLPDSTILSAYDDESQDAFELFRTAPPDAVRDYWSHALHASLERQGTDSEWMQILRDSLAHDCAGPAREAILQQRPWGFDLIDITCPVRMWHSRGDSMVPVQTAELTRKLLRYAELRIDLGDEHVPTDSTVREALDFLAPGPL